jgi:hypothetical protein
LCGGNVEIRATGKIYEVTFSVYFVSDGKLTHLVTAPGDKIIRVRIVSDV